MKVYLAGPMRGIPEYNFPAFFAAAKSLRGGGYEVWSPAEHDVEQDGFNPATDTPHSMVHYMRRDLPAVLNSDMVAVLPGWADSVGARLETHVAAICGIPVVDSETLVPIALQSQPTTLMQEVLLEVAAAVRKFPTWPTDPLHAVAVLGEEFGELTKEIVQFTYEPHKSTRDDIRIEAIQTAAMAIRFLQSLDTYEYRRGEQHAQEVIK